MKLAPARPIVVVWGLLVVTSGSVASLVAQCDEVTLLLARHELARARAAVAARSDDSAVAELRELGRQIVLESERCYEARTGEPAWSSQGIDEGGLWLEHDGSIRLSHEDRRGSAVRISDRYVLTGSKWGAGSPYATCCEQVDAKGPRIPGGTVTYSFMINGVSLNSDCGSGCVNTAITSLPTFRACFLQEIADAFGAWSAVADITFVPVADNGVAFNAAGAVGDIRIGAHAFDGPAGTRAHTFFPPPNGTSAAGDLHFDTAEDWDCDPTEGNIDIGIVALHEIGHAIGLNHEFTDLAVMNAPYSPALNFGLLADDVIGAGEIYGEAGAATTSFLGPVGVGTDEPAAQVHLFSSTAAHPTGLRIEQRDGMAAERELLRFVNEGRSAITFENTSSGTTRTLRTTATGFELDAGLRIDGPLAVASSLARKDLLAAVDPDWVLAGLEALPLRLWRYHEEGEGVRHLGPVAEEFHSIFGFGGDPTGVSLIDAGGIALAAAKALAQERRASDARLRELEREVAQLRDLLAQLEASPPDPPESPPATGRNR